eukprot:6527846-Alexandrium_andersonii.AAC.1
MPRPLDRTHSQGATNSALGIPLVNIWLGGQRRAGRDCGSCLAERANGPLQGLAEPKHDDPPLPGGAVIRLAPWGCAEPGAWRGPFALAGF